MQPPCNYERGPRRTLHMHVIILLVCVACYNVVLFCEHKNQRLAVITDTGSCSRRRDEALGMSQTLLLRSTIR